MAAPITSPIVSRLRDLWTRVRDRRSRRALFPCRGSDLGRRQTPHDAVKAACSMRLEDFLSKQAEQVRALARKTSDPELREQLEQIARDCLAELDAFKREKENSSLSY